MNRGRAALGTAIGWARRHAWALLGFAVLFTSFRMARLEGWDDAFYVAQLTSVPGDRDLLLQDDLLALWNPFPLRLRLLTTVTDEGALLNTFSIGPAVFHSSYLWPLVSSAPPGVPRGLRGALAVASMACLVATVLAMRATLRRIGHDPATASLAAGLAVLAGPLALYGTRVYLGSHLLTALFTALFLLAGLRWLDGARPRDALLAGVAAGLLTITRWQDVLLLVLLAPLVLPRLASGGDEARRRWLGLGLAGLAFAIAVACQLLAWHLQFDRWLVMPQGPGYVQWTRPRLAPFLFSTYHGLLPWAPAFALGLAAAPFARRAPAGLRVGAALAVALSVYTCACVADWYGGESYGPRRLSSLAPVAAIGLAALLAPLARWARVAATVVVGAWAVFTLTALVSGFDDLSAALGGSPSRWHPTGVVSGHWIDRPGEWPRMLRPGFSFSDRPRTPDRVVGLAAAGAVFVGTLGAWHALARSPRLQRVAVTGGAAWLAVAAGFLAVAVRPSRPALAPWRAVVTDGPAAPESFDAPGLADAARAVAAAHAFQRGDAPRAQALLDAIRAPAALHVNRRDLEAAAADPRTAVDLRALRETGHLAPFAWP